MEEHHHSDEYLDLVDEDDQVIGRKLRSEIYAEGLSNFRVINAFIVNTKGELWIPRRALTKRIYPLCLDMSVGGHVESGEIYDQAFARETKEEVNLEIAKVPWRFLGKLTPRQDKVSAYMHVYEIQWNATPLYSLDDFVEDFWLTPRALLDRIAAGDRAKSDLPKLVKRFYLEKKSASSL